MLVYPGAVLGATSPLKGYVGLYAFFDVLTRIALIIYPIVYIFCCVKTAKCDPNNETEFAVLPLFYFLMIMVAVSQCHP